MVKRIYITQIVVKLKRFDLCVAILYAICVIRAYFLKTRLEMRVGVIMSNPDCKKSIYFPLKMSKEIEREALRQDRTVSWLLQRAWAIARAEIMGLDTIVANKRIGGNGSGSSSTPGGND